ncbi:DnaJ domain-containing protein [Moraxella lacunata]|uniref:DnaJ domain-containing protein n=1 Tax=Moraxella lacunata TaxID=477 RepID=UPI001301D8DA|nr:DnaJ domain-containing protein [Moraxella lacunata]
MKKFRTHYDNLNVARNADIAVIKAAYKALAQKYHPDKNPNNPNAQKIMQVINKAYEVLSDPIKRAEHDRWIAEQEKKAEQSYQSNQNSHAYENTANGSSSASHSNERASQNTHNQTNGYQRYYEYTNGNQDNRNYRNDKPNSNNRKKHHDQHNKQTVDKPSFWSFGRMRRTTYILLSIPTIFILVIVRIGIQGGLDLSSSLPSFEYLLLATMIELVPWSFLVFIGIKRLHDCDYKGWWILVPFVVAVIWFVRPTQGTNRFGADPRDGYFDDEIEVKKDNSFWSVVVIALLYNFALISKVIDKQNQAINYQDNTTYQDNQSNNIQTPSISPNDIKIPNVNHQPPLNPQLVLAEAQKRYEKSVTNINAVWNSLHPSTQDFLRAEQRAINKKREADCTAYGNSQSSDKDLAKAYRYLCEVLQLNERAEYLKTQLNTVVTPPEPMIEVQPLPETGATNKPNLYGDSPLQIKTNPGSHYWVKIVNAYNEREEVVSYFIRGGETLDVNLPMGSYVVKYAYGDTWYGREHLFGENTGYSKADEVLEFYRNQGYVIELIQQLNGNLHTTAIDESQF